MTVKDIRIAVTQPSHHKTRKLINRLGYKAYWHLMVLYCSAAENRPDGKLGKDPEDVEALARWDEDSGELCKAMVDFKLIDKTKTGYKIHDWQFHNPWVATQKQRSAKAKKAAEKRWAKNRKAKWQRAKTLSTQELIDKNK
jgi:hypothetical protein